MQSYKRITPIEDIGWNDAIYKLHISNKECYCRLKELEDSILFHRVQNLQQELPPINTNARNVDEKPKYKCQLCGKKLPTNYKYFCPNCGVKLRGELD